MIAPWRTTVCGLCTQFLLYIELWIQFLQTNSCDQSINSCTHNTNRHYFLGRQKDDNPTQNWGLAGRRERVKERWKTISGNLEGRHAYLMFMGKQTILIMPSVTAANDRAMTLSDHLQKKSFMNQNTGSGFPRYCCILSLFHAFHTVGMKFFISSYCKCRAFLSILIGVVCKMVLRTQSWNPTPPGP